MIIISRDNSSSQIVQTSSAYKSRVFSVKEYLKSSKHQRSSAAKHFHNNRIIEQHADSCSNILLTQFSRLHFRLHIR